MGELICVETESPVSWRPKAVSASLDWVCEGLTILAKCRSAYPQRFPRTASLPLPAPKDRHLHHHPLILFVQAVKDDLPSFGPAASMPRTIKCSVYVCAVTQQTMQRRLGEALLQEDEGHALPGVPIWGLLGFTSKADFTLFTTQQSARWGYDKCWPPRPCCPCWPMRRLTGNPSCSKQAH